MSACCLTNLGCLQIPTSVISTAGQQGPAGAAGTNGTNGATGAQGDPGFVRVASSLAPVNSGAGASKTFITQAIGSTYMPTLTGSSLLLTFNVKTNTYPPIRDGLNSRLIGIRFGGQECILGDGNVMPISAGLVETQIKVEVIRSSATEAYARVSFYGIELMENSAFCYNESNLLTGLNFTIANNFVIYGFQNATDTFTFSTLTVDKINAL